MVQRRSVSFDEFSHVFWTDDVNSPYTTADGSSGWDGDPLNADIPAEELEKLAG